MDYKQVDYKIIEALIKRGKPFKIKVTGISMEPLFLNDEFVTVEKKQSYKVGEVIVVNNNIPFLLIHRIIKIDNNIVITKGDNAVAIESFTIDKIIGRIESVYIDKIKKEINYSNIDTMISRLSYYIHKYWLKERDYKKAMNTVHAKVIKYINKKKRDKVNERR